MLNIKEEREKRGMTQDEFANLLGVSRKTIVNYEAGGNIPETKEKLFTKILSNNALYKSVELPQDEVLEPSDLHQVQRFKTNDKKELLEIALKFIANKRELNKFKIIKDTYEIDVLNKLLEIKEKYNGNIDEYLAQEV